VRALLDVNVLLALVWSNHPHHYYMEQVPTLTGTAFEAVIPKIRGYRQVADAILLYLAHSSDMKLVTFD
jgi:predicted nucleic acid-binding protein